MPVYRCNQCGLVCEDMATPRHGKLPCARCGTASSVYDTVFYIEKLLERYIAALREVKALQQPDSVPEAPQTACASPEQPVKTKPPAQLAPQALPAVDLQNTALLSTPEQHAPLQAWFAGRQIEARLDPSRVDTSGFFDDAACLIGQNYELFGELMERVCFAYRKSHGSVNLELAKLSQKDAQAINQLCRQLYSHTFFSRYHYQKSEKIVRLTLQNTALVRQFFDGGWLEWHAFMEVLKQLQARAQGFSCARGVKVVFPNEDLHELDVVCLPQGQPPLCIECKSGEFRRDIDKYLRLRKRLGLDRSRFIICATELSAEQAAGLSAMYELTFVNLQTLPPYVAQVLQAAAVTPVAPATRNPFSRSLQEK